MTIVHIVKSVKIKNAKILASGSFVEPEQNVKQKLTKLFATVLQECRAIHSFHALRLGAHPILNAHQLKYVTMLTLHPQRKNVNHSVLKILVLLELLVKQITTVRSVLVTIL